MSSNKFPGTCSCGVNVAAGAGSVRKVRGKWRVSCSACVAPKIAQPLREMLGQIDWPNGMGYTECTLEYEAAVYAARDAQRAFHDATDGLEERQWPPEAADLYETMCRLDQVVLGLQSDGAHMGERVKFDRPCPMTALLGGGRIHADGSVA